MDFIPSTKSNKQMIASLKSWNILTSTEAENAMLAVDRGNFINNYPFAYIDIPQSIGYGATISAPHMHAFALSLLKDHLVEGEKALDVGSGSGYLTACMAVMLGPKGIAVGIDHIPELVAQSIANVKIDKPGFLESNRIIFVTGDGRLGYPDLAPYNAIHVGAAAAEIPQCLLDQLKAGGRMVIPVGPEGRDQTFEIVEKTSDNKINRTKTFDVMFVPLTDVVRQYSRADRSTSISSEINKTSDNSVLIRKLSKPSPSSSVTTREPKSSVDLSKNKQNSKGRDRKSVV